MIRLVFYDGTGFDYLNALVDDSNNAGYILLLFVYVIFNGIVLINGLIGIFGNTFTTQDDIIGLTFTKLNEVEERIDALTVNLSDFQKAFQKTMEHYNSNIKDSNNDNNNSNRRKISTTRKKSANSYNGNENNLATDASFISDVPDWVRDGSNNNNTSTSNTNISSTSIGNINFSSNNNSILRKSINHVSRIDDKDNEDDDDDDSSGDGSEIIEEWTASYDNANQQAAGVLTMKPHLGRNLGSNMNDINNNRPMSSAAANLSTYQDHVKNNRSRLNTSTNL